MKKNLIRRKDLLYYDCMSTNEKMKFWFDYLKWYYTTLRRVIDV